MYVVHRMERIKSEGAGQKLIKMLTQEELKEILYYDPETGIFTWLMSRGNVKSGVIAGCIITQRYRQIMISCKRYPAHRLAFLFMTGEIPEEVDHINGERADNRWINLRACIHRQNCGNQKQRKDNTSGFKGVHLYRPSNKWLASIGHKGKRIHLGLFVTAEAAAEAYNKAALKYFGEFALLNIIEKETH